MAFPLRLYWTFISCGDVGGAAYPPTPFFGEANAGPERHLLVAVGYRLQGAEILGGLGHRRISD